ncbi:MAG: prenyltransferase/squalene oxidase repeat-containing protein, partial [Eubacteriales bacterium]
MNKKNFTGIVGFLMSVLFLLSVPLHTAAADTIHTVNDIKDIADGILSCKMDQNGSADIQAWIDGPLTETAGTQSEWYILSLRQYGDYDFTAYINALDRYLKENEIRSAVERLKFALVEHAVGYETEEALSAVLDESVGQMGIMSWIYGLHLMNNGYTAASCSADDVISTLLSMQHEDGGWSVSGTVSDVDVTAMTIQALAPNVSRNDRVGTAIETALQLLSDRQQEDGCYTSYGVSNPESAAQVWIALSALGIDCTQDERFIKNGCTVIDGILKFRLQDGSFSHTEGGASNETATVQVLTASVAALRMAEGKTPFYLMERMPSDPSGNHAAASVP